MSIRNQEQGEWALLVLHQMIFFGLCWTALNTARYLGICVELKPREIWMKWCQDVSENNKDNSAICLLRSEQVVMPSAFSIFSLTFPMPQTWASILHSLSLDFSVESFCTLLQFCWEICKICEPQLPAFYQTNTLIQLQTLSYDVLWSEDFSDFNL